MNFLDAAGQVLVDAEGCPEAMAVFALREATIHFLRESYGWQTGVSVSSAATSTPAQDEIKIIDICDAFIGGDRVCITFMNDDEAEASHQGGVVMRFADPDKFTLSPVPTVPVMIDLLVIAIPSPESLTFPDHIWREYGEALRHGALARILASSKKPWTDYRAAEYHGNLFEKGVKDATIVYQRNRRNRGRQLRVKPMP